MLNLSVVPLDGSPVLTTPVTFSSNPALGSPWTTDQQGNGNCSAVWLDSGISGLAGNVSIGTLTVTLPTNATSSSAYAVHFDHVSASPNGIASFPKQAKTGLITFSSRTNSSWGDGIPDSWRLRYFLTLNNLLSATNADADGDGMNNLPGISGRHRPDGSHVLLQEHRHRPVGGLPTVRLRHQLAQRERQAVCHRAHSQLEHADLDFCRHQQRQREHHGIS